ncbi:hypothetical protein SK854_42355 [Lentzea sp. BCCO 10_0061]|uniref:Uncharacterized protein n=1 Tax=Lentzea sokolovensis TaxID=3095429 RepID=A0ABU4VD55_9PSEU|nr:hypothetical protein [Lentzea sp. BCCO 10_0061]MDX8148820.1 hypothetical protein [Lentzea sp. BCCO 10_0061]
MTSSQPSAVRRPWWKAYVAAYAGADLAAPHVRHGVTVEVR